MRKKVEKMFHALHKVDMRACYAKQKVNLAYPNPLNHNVVWVKKTSTAHHIPQLQF